MKQIFINIPVKDLERSIKFYSSLGFTIKHEFTDDEQKCMVWSEQIYIMLMSIDKFKSYSKKSIPDLKSSVGTYFTLPVESLDKVNEAVENGKRAGGIEPIPMIDHGFMQIRRLEDFDGHNWDIIYLDMKKFNS